MVFHAAILRGCWLYEELNLFYGTVQSSCFAATLLHYGSTKMTSVLMRFVILDDFQLIRRFSISLQLIEAENNKFYSMPKTDSFMLA